MLRLIHSLSAFWFYLLGCTFFLAIVLFRNDIWPLLSEWWLRVADLPLLFCGLLYAGISVHGSLKEEDGSTPAFIALIIAVPLVLLFLTVLILNFFVRTGI